MKLYLANGACSLGIHLLLEEIGAPYDIEKLDIRGGDTQKSPFIDINPKGKVPTLEKDDGVIVTEYPVIAHYLAKSHPEAGLLPKGETAALTAASATDYCVATIHMQGFARTFRPGNFTPAESDHEAVVARGKEMIAKGYSVLDKQLAGTEWIAGDYSYADSALFYVSYWGVKRLGLQLPANLAKHYERMVARPAVQRMMQQEGLQA